MTNTFAWNPGDFFRLYAHKPLPEGRKARIAAAQMHPTDDPVANLDTIAAIAAAAAQDGAELVVFPARALTGLSRPGETAIAVDAPLVDAFARLAKRLGIHLIAGFAERDETRRFDSAALAEPDGLLGIYRKIHLTQAERQWATAGDAWAVFDLPFGRLGLLIGHDMSFPEAGRVLALKGCDVIACSAAIRDRFHAAHMGTTVAQPDPIPTGPDALHWHQYRVRAGENNCWLAFANVHAPLVGYPGLSGVFGPDTFLFPRQEAVVGNNQRYALAEIDTSSLGGPYPTHVTRRKDLVLMRQPHHYGHLVATHAPDSQAIA